MKKTEVFEYSGQKIEVEVCEGLKMLVGLMTKYKEDARALVFNFKKPSLAGIHSFFVGFPFLAIWIDGEGEIIETRLVRPWRFNIVPKKPYFKLIEIPKNEYYVKKGLFSTH